MESICENNGTVYNYDFTSSISNAYGSNMKLKGSKYCFYSGDINYSNYMDLSDIIGIYNDGITFVSGNYLRTDLNADGFVDISDLTICHNNTMNFVGIVRP